MSFPCDNPCIVCPPPPIEGHGLAPNDPNNPYLNLSSEAPDIDLFIGRRYTDKKPPLGQFFYSVGCVGICFSNTSQEDADLCAARQVVLCESVNWPISIPNPEFPGTPQNPQPPTIRNDRPVFRSRPQSVTYTCPDGFESVTTIPGGLFLGFSQAEADAKAASYAQQHAVDNRICMGPLSADRVCLDTVSGLELSVEAANTPLLFDVINNALPPGIEVADDGINFFLIGDLNTAGDFGFTLLVTDSNGNQSARQYEFTVIGITNESPLDEATVNTPYAVQLDVGGTPFGLLSYIIVGGSLPTGLTLNVDTGVISGTPTVEGSYTFTVRLGDQAITCDQQFTIVAVESACIDWTQIVWGAPTITGAATGTFNQDLISLSITDAFGVPAGVADAMGTMIYNGPVCACRLIVDITDTGPPGTWPAIGLIVRQNGVPVLSIATTFEFPGPNNFDFNLFDTFGLPMNIEVLGSDNFGGSDYYTRTGGFFNAGPYVGTMQLVTI